MVDCVTVWESERPLTVLEPDVNRSRCPVRCSGRSWHNSWFARASNSPEVKRISDVVVAPAAMRALQTQHPGGARAVCTAEPSLSTPTTEPCGPTSRATRRATSPTPLPPSSTRIPEVMPASRKSLSVIAGSTPACRVRRAHSSLEFAKGYEGSVCRVIAVLLIRVVSRSPPSAALFGRGVPCSEGSRGRAVGHRGCRPEL